MLSPTPFITFRQGHGILSSALHQLKFMVNIALSSTYITRSLFHFTKKIHHSPDAFRQTASLHMLLLMYLSKELIFIGFSQQGSKKNQDAHYLLLKDGEIFHILPAVLESSHQFLHRTNY